MSYATMLLAVGLGGWSEIGWDVPPERSQHAIAYDSVRARLVLFGGRCETGDARCPSILYLGDVWEWNAETRAWAQITPATADAPSARMNHRMAFHAPTARVVLFGGGGNDQKTWLWDGARWASVSPAQPADAPLPRSGHGMAADTDRGVVVLFAGVTQPACNLDPCRDLPAETWEWDGQAWANRTPLPGATVPLGGAINGFAYDAARREMVLYLPTANSSETWTWSGSAWTKKEPTAAAPSRGNAPLAYDAARQRIVLFGGNQRDVWEWDGTTWTGVTLPFRPSERDLYALSYDSMRQRVVLVGGQRGPVDKRAYPQDIWEYGGATPSWVEQTPVPRTRTGFAMAYDSTRERALVFGGHDQSRGYGEGAFLDDLWALDPASGRWSRQPPADASAPSARLSAMAYDSARDRVVLFGGNDETWEWDGATSTWQQSEVAHRPPARTQHALAYDVARGETVMFGGVPLRADTWTYDGSDWTERTVADGAAPLARQLHAMAYDEVRQNVVLYGGVDATGGPCCVVSYSDTWEWDGQAWHGSPTASPLGERRGPGMAFSPKHGKVVLFGGSASEPASTIWTWDGSLWEEIPAIASGRPPPRTSTGLVASRGSGGLVAFGGVQGDLWYSDTWVFRYNAPPVLEEIGAQQIYELDLLAFDVRATDADGDPIAYGVENLPPGATFDSASGRFEWRPTCRDAGIYPDVRFSASDGAGDASETIEISVSSINCAPVLEPVAPASARPGERIAFALAGSDPDGDALEFRGYDLPEGAVLDPSGAFEWTPQSAQLGEHAIQFEAWDSELGDRKPTTLSVVIGDDDGGDGKSDEPPDGQASRRRAAAPAGCDCGGASASTLGLNGLGVFLFGRPRRRPRPR